MENAQRRGERERAKLFLPFDQPPAFLLDTAFCGVDNEELTALLQLGIPRDFHPAFVVIASEF